jgi:Coiled-coil domain-containing protein 124 /Oxs1
VELAKRQEEEQLRLQREAEAAKKRQSRMADEDEYERMVLVSNTNRDDSIIEAHSVDDALTKMTIAEPALAPDRHPERRLKATFKVFIVYCCSFWLNVQFCFLFVCLLLLAQYVVGTRKFDKSKTYPSP